MKKSGYFILCLIFLTFCAEKKSSNYIVFDDKDLPKVKLLSSKFEFNEIMDPRGIDMVGGLLGVMEGYRTSEDVPAIHFIETEKMTYYRSKGAKGQGPYELRVASTLFPGNTSDTFWVYSAMDKKMLAYSIQDTSRLAISEYSLPEIAYKVVKISQATDSTFLGISAYDPSRVIEFHRDGQKVAGYGEWEKVETHPELNNAQLYRLNSGWFKGDQELGLHVSACIFRDRLEIFDYHSKKWIIVDGPGLDFPTFRVIGEGLDIPQKENPYRYRDISITQDHIFALYGGIGEFEYRETSRLAEKIYVFSHTGEPQALLELDRSIGGLAVDTVKKKIFGITTDEDPGIAVFNFPEALL